MGKQVKTNFETLLSLEEVITSESNCQDMLSSWKTIEKDGDYLSSDYLKEDSNASNSSISSSLSLDFMEDASSSSCSSSSNGPLYQLSDLMDQLPIKRGLSKYYKGKSESFASLSSVESVEDLPKRENQYMKKIKLYKSFCGRLDAKKLTSPKGNILKKPSYKSSYSSSILKRNCSNNIMDSCRIPSIPLHKDF